MNTESTAGQSRRIVILGGTRGLGFCLAREFLACGCRVFLTGRSQDAVAAACASLSGPASAGIAGRARLSTPCAVSGCAADISSYDDCVHAAHEAQKAMGGIDVWINNAGINQEPGKIRDVTAGSIEAVIRTNLTGAMFGAKAAMEALAAGGGSLWFVEGHGSDGRIMDGLSVYGTSKRGLRYLWQALAQEARDTSVLVGAISPGIMVTDFIMENKKHESPEKWKRAVRFFNILADRPETVAAWLVPRMLTNTRNSARLAWLTTPKIVWRFMTVSLLKRRIMEE